MTECSWSAESEVHRRAKQWVADQASLVLPDWRPERPSRPGFVQPVIRGGEVGVTQAWIEMVLGGFRPDVVVRVHGPAADRLLGPEPYLAIEILFTHRVGTQKQQACREASQAMIEIDVGACPEDALLFDQEFDRFMGAALRAARWLSLPGAERWRRVPQNPVSSGGAPVATGTESRPCDPSQRVLHLSGFSSPTLRWLHEYPSVARPRGKGVAIARKDLGHRPERVGAVIAPLLDALESVPDHQEAWHCQTCLAYHPPLPLGPDGRHCPNCGAYTVALFEGEGPECYETLVYRLAVAAGLLGKKPPAGLRGAQPERLAYPFAIARPAT